MRQDVVTLTKAIELVAAGSWAIDSALRCIEENEVGRATTVLESAQATVREGLEGLSRFLDESVRAEIERPERLARALASLQELRDLSPTQPE